MIELIWQDYNCEKNQMMMCMTSLLSWFTNIITMSEQYHHLSINGYVVIKAPDGTFTGIVVCDPEYQNELLKIIQQPPSEFRGKYIACIPSGNHEEPMPVKEVLPPPSDSKTTKVKYENGVWIYCDEEEEEDKDDVEQNSTKESVT